MASTHPIIEYYHGAVFMDSGGYRMLVKTMQAQPPTQEEVRLQGAGQGDSEDLAAAAVKRVAQAGLPCLQKSSALGVGGVPAGGQHE